MNTGFIGISFILLFSKLVHRWYESKTVLKCTYKTTILISMYGVQNPARLYEEMSDSQERVKSKSKHTGKDIISIKWLITLNYFLLFLLHNGYQYNQFQYTWTLIQNIRSSNEVVVTKMRTEKWHRKHYLPCCKGYCKG